MNLVKVIQDARRGEYARQLLEKEHDRLSGNRIWSLKDKSVDELVREILEMLKAKK